MKKLTLLILLCFLPNLALAVDYTIDADHSTVGFKVKHLAISTVAGRFATFEGTFSYNPQDIEASKVEAKIDAKSINTEQPKRDDHLRKADFLNVEKSPYITFKSKKIEIESQEEFKVLGDLTINGVTKPVTLEVQFGGLATDPWGNERAAFSAQTTINRSDFNMVWNKVLETGGLVVGEKVTINLEIEGIKKAADGEAAKK